MLLDASAVLAQEHIDELRRDAAKQRLVRAVRRRRRERRPSMATGGRLRAATVR
jgi:hypothetical protein